MLVESEYVGNKQIADYLTGIGHPTSVEDSMNQFMGLAGLDFIGAIERWIGHTLPDVRRLDLERESGPGTERWRDAALARRFCRHIPVGTSVLSGHWTQKLPSR